MKHRILLIISLVTVLSVRFVSAQQSGKIPRIGFLKDFETAFRAADKGKAGAVLFRVAGPYAASQRPQIAEFAVKSQLPVMHELAADVEAGGLMTYGVNEVDLDRRAAVHVDSSRYAR